MKFHLLALPLALLMVACAVQSQDGIMEAETRKGGFMGLATNDALEVDTPKAFSGTTKVVIGGFKVGFNESKRLSNKASGTFLSSGFGGKSTGLVKLEGVDPEILQEITDRAYQDFQDGLTALGYTILPRSEFLSHAGYSGTKEYDFPYVSDNSGIFSSYGIGTFHSPRAIGPKQPIFLNEIDGVTGGIGFSNPMNAVAKFGEDTGIPVLNVTYLVDFAGAGGHAGVSYSSLTVGQLMSVDKGIVGIGSGYMGTFSTKVGKITLGQPIGSDIPFATVSNTTSDVAVGVETATNVFSALLGGGTNQMREFVFQADPAKYQEAALDVLTKANKAFGEKMASLR